MLRTASILLALSVSGCVIHSTGRTTTVYEVEATAYAEPVYVKVNQPPPPLRADVRPGPKPFPDAVWVSGHWRWSGDRGWVWVHGRWMRPRPGYVWEPPVVVAVEDGSYQYHPGYWRPANVAPPPVYRTPGTILVHARPAGARVVVERVPPRRARQTTVVVRPAPPSAPSSTVVVRPRPATATATVSVRPSQPSSNATVTVRPSQPSSNATVTVRPSQPSSNTTVSVRPSQPSSNTTVTVRPSQPSSNATVTVRPSQPSSNATVTVRPSQPARTQTTVRANTTVQPTTSARTQTTVRANTTVQPTTSARTQTTVRANTTVRPATSARPATPTRPGATVGTATARPATMVATTAGRPGVPTGPAANVMAPQPQVDFRPTCRPALAVTAPGGVLVLRGQNLQTVTQVQLGGQTLAISSKRADEIRARVPERARGGAVHIRAGNRQYSCGNVSVRGGR